MDILTEKNQINPETIVELLQIDRDLKKLEARKKELNKKIFSEMKKRNLLQILQDGVALLYVRDKHTRATFDSKALESMNKRLYDYFVKTTNVSESLTVKWIFDSTTMSVDDVINSIEIPKDQT